MISPNEVRSTNLIILSIFTTTTIKGHRAKERIRPDDVW